jgi:hypothetical protein
LLGFPIYEDKEEISLIPDSTEHRSALAIRYLHKGTNDGVFFSVIKSFLCRSEEISA